MSRKTMIKCVTTVGGPLGGFTRVHLNGDELQGVTSFTYSEADNTAVIEYADETAQTFSGPNLKVTHEIVERAYARVTCHGDCGSVDLDVKEYTRQMDNPDRPWMCPRCRDGADFDDVYFDARHPSPGPDEDEGVSDEDVSPDPNVEAIKREFTERSIRGFGKYGVTTADADLTLEQWLQHAKEEAMDFTIYMEAALQKLRKAKADPTEGNWIAAYDVHRLTRCIDVALNGEEGAAKQAMLCDIAGQCEGERRKRDGVPLLQSIPIITNDKLPPHIALAVLTDGRVQGYMTEDREWHVAPGFVEDWGHNPTAKVRR